MRVEPLLEATDSVSDNDHSVSVVGGFGVKDYSMY